MKPTTQTVITKGDEALQYFYEDNRDFDLENFIFSGRGAIDSLKIRKAEKEHVVRKLKAYQRLLKVHDDPEVAVALYGHAMDSARKITSLSESQFIREFALKLKGGPDTAIEVYRNANTIKTQVTHLWANIHQLRKSPYYMNLAAAPAPQSVAEPFENLSSYQKLFGTLNYCDCPECKSILGPAAYLTDLLRLIDKSITKPNTGIPHGLAFNERRPDIANIKLTCANTNNLVPYLQIVNEILVETLQVQLSATDVYFDLATRFYPFNLPFNLPLAQIRTYLGQGHTSLSDVFLSMQKADGLSLAAALEYLGISADELGNFKKPASGKLEEVLTANYGLPITQQNMGGLQRVNDFISQTGISLQSLKDLLTENLNAEEIFNVSGAYSVTHMKGNEIDFQQSGTTVIARCSYANNGQIEINGNVLNRSLQGLWTDSDGSSGYCELEFTSDCASFTGHWNKGMGQPWESTTWDGTRKSDAVPAPGGIIQHNFFINTPLANGAEYLFITSNAADPGDVHDEIANLNLDTLDTLNRFIRLSQKLTWEYARLDWTLLTLSAVASTREITDDIVEELAKVKKLEMEYALPPALIQTLWYDIKTTGIGTAQFSEAPFDQIFNGPEQIGYADSNPYRPKYEEHYKRFVNPLYQSDVVDWSIKKTESADLTTAGDRIVSAIPVPMDAIRQIAFGAFGDIDSLKLTVENLSVLYRHAMLMKHLNMQAGEYILLLKLLGFGETGAAGLITHAIVPDQAITIVKTQRWMREQGLSALVIDYLCHGKSSTYVNPGYSRNNVPAFVTALYLALQKVLLQQVSFSGNGIPAEVSQALFDWMKKAGQDFVDASGLVSNSKILQVQEIPDSITLPDSTKFKFTDLQKINIVQVTDAFRSNQRNTFSTALASFFQVKTDLMDCLIKQVSTILSIPDYLGSFMMPVLFPTPAVSVLKDSSTELDIQKLLVVFQKKGISLPKDVKAEYNQHNGWTLTDAGKVVLYCGYRFADGSDIFFFSQANRAAPDSLLFVYNFISSISRFNLLNRNLEISNKQIAGITDVPAAYNQVYVVDPVAYSISFEPDNLVELRVFKSLESEFGDRNDLLVSYLYNAGTSGYDACAELAAITGWNKDQCEALCVYFFGAQGKCTDIKSIRKLTQAFAITKETGIDVYFLQQLNEIASWQVTDSSNWKEISRFAATQIQSVQAVTSPEAWPATLKKMHARLEEAKRNAMLNLSIYHIGKQYPDIQTANNLYEFLLIDVNRAGCQDISYVKEALNAAQLYLQRCRLNVERNVVIDKADIPDVFWEWIMNYRIWEANREVFLYPENYLDPSLRESKTDLFKELENNLSQGNVTRDTVAAAYRKYLDAFQQLATLQYVSGYSCYTGRAGDEASETMFLFARTQAIPYQYYYISRQPGDIWSQWNKINITINAEHVAPVYANGKLFVFWSEITEVTERSDSGGKTTSRKASVKYSFYNFSGDWIPPQTLIHDRVVYASGCEIFIKGITNDKDEILSPVLFDFEQTWWQKPYVLGFHNTNYWNTDDNRNKQGKIVVLFGPLVDASGYTAALKVPDIKGSDPAVEFEESLAGCVKNINSLVNTNNNHGYVPLIPACILETDLDDGFLIYPQEFIVVEKNSPLDFVPSVPFLDRLSNNLYLVKSDSVIENNYNASPDTSNADIEPMSALNKDSFVSSSNPVITPSISEDTFNQLVSAGYLDAAGKIVLDKLDFTTLLTALAKIYEKQPDEQALTDYTFGCFCEALGTPLLFSELNPQQDTVFSISNDATSFIMTHGTESFLITRDNQPLQSISSQTEILEAVFDEKSFITNLLNVTGSQMVFKGLINNGYMDEAGRLWAEVEYDDLKSVLENILAGQPSKDQIVQECLNILYHQPLFNSESFTSTYITPSGSGEIFTGLQQNGYVDVSGRLNADYSLSDILEAVRLILENQPFKNVKVAEVMKIVIDAIRSVSLKYFQAGQESVKSRYGNYQFNATRLTTSAIGLLSQRLFAEGIDSMLSLSSQDIPVESGLRFDRLGPSPVFIIPPDATDGDQVDFSGPYGNYYWELFFHGPMLVSKVLNNNQRFADAESWLQYVFNPTINIKLLSEGSFETGLINSHDSTAIFGFLKSQPDPFIGSNGFVTSLANQTSPLQLLQLMITAGLKLQANRTVELTAEVLAVLQNNFVISSLSCYWQFRPFRNHTLETLKEQLTSPSEIRAYNLHPFDPHAIARLRIGAYEKSTVMQYVSNLISWGDSEYRLYTWESITSALMFYIYAYDLLGPRPVDLGSCPAEFPVNFNEILQKYEHADEGIPQFLIDMENAISSSISFPGIAAKGDTPFNDIEAYFCIPENETFISNWDTIENRLYNIRHCLNINGVAQSLPLFEPPINPMDLVKATAAGNNTLNLASLVQPNIPPYRFSAIIERARLLTSTVIQLGGSLLAVLEKSDAEALSLLQSTNELNLLNLTTVIKQQQITDAQNQLAALQQTLENAQYKQQYFTRLITDGLNVFEIQDLDLRGAAMIPQEIALGINGVSIAAYLAPNIFGLADGGMQFGEAVNAGANISSLTAEILNQSAGMVATAGTYQRRQEDWEFQKENSGYEIAQINSQILAAQARIALAQQDLIVHQKNIVQTQAVSNFIRTKFTNRDMYQWMSSRLSSLYFQTYNLALTMALQAQATYQFELDSSDRMITFSYWDDLYKGLLAGESLMMSLQQMESVYVQNDARTFEIEKTISIGQSFPEEFLKFKWGHNEGVQGKLDFTLSEKLFDFDFPGQYCRKIKSVSISIPAVIGPYQSLNAILRQNSNWVILLPVVEAVEYALAKTVLQTGLDPAEPPLSVMRQNWVSNQAIALSRGVDDSGTFVLNFNDDRYLPFEGTGAVSSWTLDLPPDTNRINFDSISDVLITVRYTAKNGDSIFAGAVKDIYKNITNSSTDYVKAKTFDLKQAFYGNWQLFFTPPDAQGIQTISFPIADNYWLTNLANINVGKLAIQLEVAGGKSIDQSDFCQLKTSTAVKLFDVKKNYAALDSNQLGAMGFGAGSKECILQFLADKLPDDIAKVVDGKRMLDETKLTDIAIVIFYTEKPFA